MLRLTTSVSTYSAWLDIWSLHSNQLEYFSGECSHSVIVLCGNSSCTVTLQSEQGHQNTYTQCGLSPTRSVDCHLHAVWTVTYTQCGLSPTRSVDCHLHAVWTVTYTQCGLSPTRSVDCHLHAVWTVTYTQCGLSPTRSTIYVPACSAKLRHTHCSLNAIVTLAPHLSVHL